MEGCEEFSRLCMGGPCDAIAPGWPRQGRAPHLICSAQPAQTRTCASIAHIVAPANGGGFAHRRVLIKPPSRAQQLQLAMRRSRPFRSASLPRRPWHPDRSLLRGPVRGPNRQSGKRRLELPPNPCPALLIAAERRHACHNLQVREEGNWREARARLHLGAPQTSQMSRLILFPPFSAKGKLRKGGGRGGGDDNAKGFSQIMGSGPTVIEIGPVPSTEPVWLAPARWGRRLPFPRSSEACRDGAGSILPPWPPPRCFPKFPCRPAT